MFSRFFCSNFDAQWGIRGSGSNQKKQRPLNNHIEVLEQRCCQWNWEKGPWKVRGKNIQGHITKVRGKGNFKTEVLNRA